MRSDAVFRSSNPSWAITGPSELFSKQSRAEPYWDPGPGVFVPFLPGNRKRRLVSHESVTSGFVLKETTVATKNLRSDALGTEDCRYRV